MYHFKLLATIIPVILSSLQVLSAGAELNGKDVELKELSPDKDKEDCHQLFKRSDRWDDKPGVAEIAIQLAEAKRKVLEDAKEDAKEHFEDAKEDAKEHLEDAKEDLKDAKEDAKEDLADANANTALEDAKKALVDAKRVLANANHAKTGKNFAEQLIYGKLLHSCMLCLAYYVTM